jgi:CheY-like chemotaxis protein
VFEPFFTTKPVGKGTGLGMSQIFGFVGQCRGAIDIRSAPGEGTSIRILLPRMAHDEKFATMKDTQQEMATDGAERDRVATERSLTILAVEDDPRVLRSTMAALAALGHVGLACDHPAKAADMLAEHPDIALILSDVLMPDMSGPEMIETLGAVIAERPVIFVTGFAGDQGLAAQIAGFPILRKPFTIGQLAAVIGSAMAQGDGLRDGRAASPAI